MERKDKEDGEEKTNPKKAFFCFSFSSFGKVTVRAFPNCNSRHGSKHHLAGLVAKKINHRHKVPWQVIIKRKRVTKKGRVGGRFLQNEKSGDVLKGFASCRQTLFYDLLDEASSSL